MAHSKDVAKSRIVKRFGLALCLAATLLLTGCESGQSQTTEVGAHKLTVKNFPSKFLSRQGLEEHDGIAILRRQSMFGPQSLEVVINKNQELAVNGRSYGKLKHGDSVTVDSDKVFINSNEAQEIASR